MPHYHRYCLLALLLAAAPLNAKDRPFLDEPDPMGQDEFVEREWQEGEVVLPEHINEKDLQEFQVDPPDPRFRYFIERGSLHTASDGVTRFVLVIRSNSGAINSSYEGLRCGQRQYKVYAYGAKEGLKRLPGARWQSFLQYSSETYRKTLYNDLLCNLSTGQANPPDAVFRAMRAGERVKGHFTLE
jgi:hypothetical protein